MSLKCRRVKGTTIIRFRRLRTFRKHFLPSQIYLVAKESMNKATKSYKTNNARTQRAVQFCLQIMSRPQIASFEARCDCISLMLQQLHSDSCTREFFENGITCKTSLICIKTLSIFFQIFSVRGSSPEDKSNLLSKRCVVYSILSDDGRSSNTYP